MKNSMTLNKTIFWHNLWVSAGHPSSGTIQRIKCLNVLVKLNIKLLLRRLIFFLKRNMVMSCCTTISTKIPQSSGCLGTLNSRKILESNFNEVNVANEFASHFSKVYCNSCNDSAMLNEFLSLHPIAIQLLITLILLRQR
jgi:hypothetical protein